MTKRFENLTTLLNHNPKLRDAFFQKFQGKTEYLSILESTISFFAHTHGKMLIAKIKVTSTLKKFDSLISELNTAKIFAQKGCEIHLLPDDYFKSASPDILCKCHNFSFYVEVTQLSDSEPTLKIIEELREILRKNRFDVRIEFNDKLSPPRFSGKERQEQEKILEKSMEQFKKELELLPLGVTDHEIITDGIKFSLSYSGGKSGIPCSFMSSYKFPEELFEKYVTYRLLEKAKKREAFEGPERNRPYIVTFVSENISIDDLDFKDLLFGHTMTLLVFPFEDPEITRLATIKREKDWAEILDNKDKHIFKWQEIEAAANRGWHDFLTAIHYIPHDYTYLSKEGLFLSDPLIKNVSGILLIRKSSESYFYPNPFCDEEISISNFQNFFI